MRPNKQLGVATAAVSLAAAGLVGISAPMAQASDTCQNLYTRYNAVVQECVNWINPNDVTMSYKVTQRGSTDERIWFEVYAPGCGNSYGYTDFSANDVTNPTGFYEEVCKNPVQSVQSWSTESGQQYGNGNYWSYS